MMTTTAELYGRDIWLDSQGQARVAANGEAVVCSGISTVLQDIELRLRTPLGTLFYDVEFGSLIHLWVREESTPQTRMALAAEVKQRIMLEPRVQPLTVTCKVLTWDYKSVTLQARFTLIEDDHPYNLVVAVGSDFVAVAVADVNPR